VDQFIVVVLPYCHHILAINRLELASIILDQTCLKPVEPRRLFVRKTTKGRPKQTKRKDFSYRIKYFFSIPTEQIKAKILMFLQGNIKIMP